MFKLINKYSVLASAIMLSISGVDASQAEQKNIQVGAETSATITTAIAKRAKTTTVVNDDIETGSLKGQSSSVVRTNVYSSQQSSSNLEQELKAFQSLDFKNQKNTTRAEMQKHRAETSKLPKSSGKAQKNGLSHLYIHDAAVLLFDDNDGDGYYSQLRVDFDVDSSYADYFDVYAELFIRRVGDTQWTHYYTTDVFEIYYDYGSDEYSVTTRLNTGFPPGNYEVLIDLFEYGYSDTVDTLDPYDDYDLANLPLEDKTYESTGVTSDTYVDNVKTEIFTDSDDDGFYREFTITFDVDTEDTADRDVYVNLYQRTDGGSWQFETETDVFTVYGYSSEDAFEISGNWQSGYPANYYDFRLEVIDANSGEVLDDVSPEFSPLLQVPLEDANSDTRDSSPNPPSSTTSSESGGGSTGIFMLILLGLLGACRKIIKR
ncbi:choice-of-anchor H family protein [Kangiella marina]|uniref:GlyGly-CTERM sorting domain-containing protein n=1 Tax=Kangiella marina TaxID=1079178 RepID=A0ABP8ICG9_9GAMM